MARQAGSDTLGAAGAEAQRTITQLRELLRREPAPPLALTDWLERLLSVGIVTNNPRLAQRQRCDRAHRAGQPWEAFRTLAKGHFELVERGVTEIRGID